MNYKVIKISTSLKESSLSEKLNEKTENGWSIISTSANKDDLFIVMKKD